MIKWDAATNVMNCILGIIVQIVWYKAVAVHVTQTYCIHLFDTQQVCVTIS